MQTCEKHGGRAAFLCDACRQSPAPPPTMQEVEAIRHVVAFANATHEGTVYSTMDPTQIGRDIQEAIRYLAIATGMVERG